MKRISNIYKIKNSVATLGIFDGVHRGHQKILKRLVKEAVKQKRKTLVITFYPHPRQILRKHPRVPLLTSLEHRLRLIKDLGIDFFLVIRFTKSISRMKPEDFIRKVLVEKLNIKTLVVGENFLFGYKKEGDFRLLKNLAKFFGFPIIGVKPVKVNKSYISSTRIRRAIEKGDLKHASLMLARPVTVLGTVVGGKKVGRSLGFPTANINPHHEAIPPQGVYAVDVRFCNKIYKAVLNIGTRPTLHKDKRTVIELHILNFEHHIYGKDVEIIFKKKIREERRFKSREALQLQIQRDILRAS